MTSKVNFFKDIYMVSCPKGLEKQLSDELSALGINDPRQITGGVTFKTTVDKAFQVIFHSRIASRIFKKYYSFKAADEHELYKTACKIEWDKVFEIKQTFKIKTILSKDLKNKNSMFFSQKLKDGICDSFRRKHQNLRPDVDKDMADLSFQVYVEKLDNNNANEISIFLDMTGVPLSNRGYRSEKFPAPLRENLAAAIVMSMNWDKKQLFLDTMCGSGTLLIEAALIKGEIPPSFLKLKNKWDFQKHLYYRNNPQMQRRFKKELAKTKEMVEEGFARLNKSPDTLRGFDISPASIRVVKRHLKNCSLYDIIPIRKHDAVTLERPDVESGIIACNVPYGERMGEIAELETMYHQYGENLKHNFKGFTAYIFTGNQQLSKKISLRTKRRIPFYNGQLDCRLLEFELF